MSNKQANKVQFGLKNVHYAPIEKIDDVTQEITYGKIKRIPGAVNLTLDPKGDKSEFFADDTVYYSEFSNQGYEGTLEIALIPEHFAVDILGEVKDEATGMLTEATNAKHKDFALMFEFDGDKHATRHVNYNCSVSRPSQVGETKGESTEPTTNELELTASARPADMVVKRRTTVDTPQEFYNKFFEEVPEIAEKTTFKAPVNEK